MAFSFVGCTADLNSNKPPDELTTQQSITADVTVDSEKSSSEEVVISDDVVQSANDTYDAIESGEDLASSEQLEASVEDEKSLEQDAAVEQENISYDGSSEGSCVDLLGPYQGRVFFNQGDSRWAKYPYTSSNNKSQTMKSSGCGPTSAAMVISSSKGFILPTTVGDLFVDNGYRTRDNGTAWAAFPWVADAFDFNTYNETSSFDVALNYMKTDNDNDGISDFLVIMSCNNGLWTSGGHYVVWMNQSGNQSAINDPFLYNGKYDTASRRAANVTVSGNTAYLSVSNLKKYSNAKRFFIFSNDQTGKANTNSKPTPKPTPSNTTAVSYVRYVATQSQNLNVRSGPGTGYKVVGSLPKGTKVNVSAVSNGFSEIGKNKWVSSSYLSSVKPGSLSASSISSYKTEVGKTYKLKARTTLYSNPNLTGTRYDYLANTSAKVVSHSSSTVDYVYIVKTGRYCYCLSSDFSGVSTSNSSSKSKVSYVYVPATGRYAYCPSSKIEKVNGVYRLKENTVLYSKSNLTGTKYNYLVKTKIIIKKTL